MTTAADIREALGVALMSIDGLTVHDHPRPQVSALPAVVIFPGEPLAEFDSTFANGSHEWNFELLVVLSRGGDDEINFDTLDAFTAPTGPGSIKGAIEADDTLGGVVHYARVQRARSYGTVSIGSIDGYLAITFDLEVLAT